jgi:hypothetical protein
MKMLTGVLAKYGATLDEAMWRLLVKLDEEDKAMLAGTFLGLVMLAGIAILVFG